MENAADKQNNLISTNKISLSKQNEKLSIPKSQMEYNKIGLLWCWVQMFTVSNLFS